MSRIELDSARPMYYHLGYLPRPIPGAAQRLATPGSVLGSDHGDTWLLMWC